VAGLIHLAQMGMGGEIERHAEIAKQELRMGGGGVTGGTPGAMLAAE
jgi:hypothetical protein